ncbi:MAG: YceI family protein [Burkholderiaceae bacterium]|nr:YceI family protein [Burkholderiaceae bacterium]
MPARPPFPVATACAVALAAAATLAAAPATGAPVRHVVEPNHTFVTFEVRHFDTSTVRARFDRVDGFVVVDATAKRGEADITIDTASISSGIASFDEHLRNADFLDVGRYPTARFRSTDFRFFGDRVISLVGELTMLGKTLPVRLDASHFNCYDSPIVKARVCGGDFETKIERSRWGMNWGIDRGVPDRVRLLIQIEAVAQP